mgnify:CR=1 FL=1
MKLHVLRPEQQGIENYTIALVVNNEVNLSQVCNNECEVIMANDAIDSFSIDRVPALIESLASKLRINGKLVIGGTDIRLLSKSIINDQMAEEEGSNMIGSINSATNPLMIKAIIQKLGLSYVSTQISGVHYEITAKRG